MDLGLNISHATPQKPQKFRKLSPFLLFVKHRKPAMEAMQPGISMKDILF